MRARSFPQRPKWTEKANRISLASSLAWSPTFYIAHTHTHSRKRWTAAFQHALSVYYKHSARSGERKRGRGCVHCTQRKCRSVFAAGVWVFPQKRHCSFLACYDRLSATVCLYSIIPALAGGGGGGHQSHLPFSSLCSKFRKQNFCCC